MIYWYHFLQTSYRCLVVCVSLYGTGGKHISFLPYQELLSGAPWKAETGTALCTAEMTLHEEAVDG